MLSKLSPGLQVFAFIIIMILMIFAGDAFYNLSVLCVVDVDILMATDLNDPRVVLSHRFFVQIFTFLVAFLYFLNLAQERFSDTVFMDRIKLRPLLITLAVLVIGFFAVPFLEYINAPLREILPPGLVEQEVGTDELQTNLIYTTDFIQYGFAMLVMALTPAICEELVFRGFLIRKMLQSGLSENGAVIMSATIFSISHMQPLKLLPMFFMGLCLGFVYMRFKNLKYAIILHFLFNGIQVTLGYLIASEIVSFEF